MPKTCVVYLCNSNNKVKVRNSTGGSSWENSGYVTVFGFPRDKDLAQKWLDALPNEKGSVPIRENNGVCINHFEQRNILGDTRKRLAKDAIPSIFPSPTGQIKQSLKRLSFDNLDIKNLQQAKKASLNSFDSESLLRSFSSFEELNNKINLIEKGDFFLKTTNYSLTFSLLILRRVVSLRL